MTKLLPLLALLSGCASLREGWVKVDFLEGQPDPDMFCHFELKKDDLTAKCVSVDGLLEMEKQKKKHKGDEASWKP
jgi:hypothetical protein